ncbi:hypothetical protein niasHT_020380 [Heterodera trifolii]|uniref:Uncharacterized protein n=1 Tax=Heterodera trifolii TaxID=157864 RepID=A0ABD2JXT3_9BILA
MQLLLTKCPNGCTLPTQNGQPKRLFCRDYLDPQNLGWIDIFKEFFWRPYKVSKPRNVQATKCPSLEMSKPRNVQATKCPSLEMSKPRNVQASKCPSLEMSKPRNVQASKCPSHEMSKPRNVQATKCPSLEMSIRDAVNFGVEVDESHAVITSDNVEQQTLNEAGL